MAIHDFTDKNQRPKKLGGGKSEPTGGKTATGVSVNAEEMQGLHQGTPPESVTLNTYYRKSGLTAADLASATGLSVGTIRIALQGVRYRNGEPRATAPSDQNLAKLASVLGIAPEILRSVGRDRAADLVDDAETTAPEADRDAKAVIAGRAALARQVLSVFSTDELRSEIERRVQ